MGCRARRRLDARARAPRASSSRSSTPRRRAFSGEGWDNSVWLVEEQWAFRFPRRAIAMPGVERELAAAAAARTTATGADSGAAVRRRDRASAFAWPFFGASPCSRRRAGRRRPRGRRSDRARRGARPLPARAARDRRHVRTSILRGSCRSIRCAVRTRPSGCAMARELARHGWRSHGGRVGPVRRRDGRCLAPRSDRSVLVHGDLHLRHVLVESGALSGVIDWGDACLGDPSIDLQIAWSLLPPEARASLFGEYGHDRRGAAGCAHACSRSGSARCSRSTRARWATRAFEREACRGFERALID